MDVKWRQTGKGTWSAGEYDRGIEARPIWSVTIRQRKAGAETVYNWTATGTRKGTYTGIEQTLAAAKEAAVVAVQTHIVPPAEVEAEEQVEAPAGAASDEAESRS